MFEELFMHIILASIEEGSETFLSLRSRNLTIANSLLFCPRVWTRDIRTKLGHERKDFWRVSNVVDLYFLHKSAIFDIFASLYIAFAKCLKMAIFHTFENLVILLPINIFELFLPCNKFEMILESIKTI